jgi:glycine/D-amino acid oxidase-like deaminating enzyme
VTQTDYSSLSLWLDTLVGDDLQPSNPLRGDADYDVAIVGGGFTGLWTAYYLAERDPSLRIAVLERDICGFGASGRNGGWCEGELVAGIDGYAKRSSPEEALRLIREMQTTVDEVGRVAEVEGIDCGYAKGGSVYLARNKPQAQRMIKAVAHEHSMGLTDDDVRLLSGSEARAMVNATDVLGGMYTPHCAAINPAPLVRGLADAVRSRGVDVHEDTMVLAIEPGRVVTSRGVVRAPVVVRAVEGYTRDLGGERRTMVPLYSLMVATEPLGDEVFDEIGLADRPTFNDSRYAVIYGQRTADNRIAFGGRGVPYLFGSRISPKVEQHKPTHELIERTLVELFPSLENVAITHRWGGVLGAPRNWTPGVSYDKESGLATGGGYVGEGVAAANLAGRTLADLITETDTDLVTLPWVGVTSRSWEPEPLRWLGVWGTRKVMQNADKREFSTNEESKLGVWAKKLL